MKVPEPLVLSEAVEVVVRLLASQQGLTPVELLKRLVREGVARVRGDLDSFVARKLVEGLGED